MQPNQSNNIPSIKQPGNWSPLDNYTNDLPPQKPSFFGRYKKLLIIAGSVIAGLILLTILAVVTSPPAEKSGNLEGVTTNIPLDSYDGEKYTMRYASGLNKALDDINESGAGWLTVFLDNTNDLPEYKVMVSVGDQDYLFTGGEDAINQLVDDGVEPFNFVSKDVVIAGNQETETSAEFKKGDKEYLARFARTAVSGEEIVTFTYYLKDNKTIGDSFDAMIGSIKLK